MFHVEQISRRREWSLAVLSPLKIFSQVFILFGAHDHLILPGLILIMAKVQGPVEYYPVKLLLKGEP